MSLLAAGPLVVLAALGAGGAGAVLRYLTSLLLSRPAARLPWAVLVVNVAGSALGGALLGLGSALDPALFLVLAGGFAGGFTTFSTLAVETFQLAERGRLPAAQLSVFAHLALGVGAAAAAFAITAQLVVG